MRAKTTYRAFHRALSALCLGLIFGFSQAHAQLVVGVDNDALSVLMIDLADPGNPIPLYSGGTNSPWAMAANEVARELYFVDQDVLYRVPYDTLVPSMIGQIRNPQGSLIDITGLAYDAVGDSLIASRTVGGDDGDSPEAIYKIDTTSAEATVQFNFVANDYEFGGLDFDNSTGKLYGASDDRLPHGRGLYEIDLTSETITQVAPYPMDPIVETDIDGLAVGDGVAYLVTDQPGDFYRYDIAAGAMDTIPSPWTANYLFSAGAWAPGLLGGTAGDFDSDGMLTCDDIDALGDAIRTNNTDTMFDVNSDGVLNVDDYHYWITDLKDSVIGDADFSGSTDVSDFNIWSSNKFTTGTGWCTGDFNGDGATDTSDFNLWNSNKFTSATPSPVPEPSCVLLLLFGVCFFASRSGRYSR